MSVNEDIAHRASYKPHCTFCDSDEHYTVDHPRSRPRMSDTLNVLIQTCPVCNGQGHVSMPPWIPGDVPTWSASGTETYDCRACGGTGLIRRDVPTAPGRAAVVEPPREDRLRDDDAHQLDRLIAEALADPSSVSVRESLYVNEITRLRSALSAAQQDSERLDWWFGRGMDDSVCDGSVDLWWADEQDGDVVTRVTHGTSVRETLDMAMRGIFDRPSEERK